MPGDGKGGLMPSEGRTCQGEHVTGGRLVPDRARVQMPGSAALIKGRFTIPEAHSPMALVFPASPQTTVAVLAGGEFPVRRIFCVGRNYAAHAREMGSDPDREAPFFFTKPADAVVPNNATVPYPPMSRNVHHEIELVVALGGEGFGLTPQAAGALVFGYAVGVDLTRRDLQNAAKDTGRPWDMGKGFDQSAPCGPITPTEACGPLASGAIWLKVNGQTRQSGDLSDLIWSVPELLAQLSRYVVLKPGDLVYTGTPDGVGPLQVGDEVQGHVDGLQDLQFRIGPAV